MFPLRRTTPDRVVFVFLAVAAAFLLTHWFPVLIPHGVAPVFLAAVLLSAWVHGMWAGIAAASISSGVILETGFGQLNFEALAAVASFLAVALPAAWLTGALQKGRGFLGATLFSLSEGVLATDEKGRVSYLNPAAEAITGWPLSEAKGRPVPDILRLNGEEDGAPLEDPARRALLEGSSSGIPGHGMLTARDGTEIPIDLSAAPIRDQRGALLGVLLVFRDITARRQLEERSSQSRKMDAVGRLAGEVAGDFNNLLTVITGYSELLRAELEDSNPMRRFADEIMYAAERAAGLTRQLLAFSRGPGTQPKLIDLNGLLGSMQPMLSRLVGEQIELILLKGPELGRITADPAQIEQVVMNLAENARDAMPGGGKLVLETGNVDLTDPLRAKKAGVEPGSYVMLAVSDTGAGMDAEVRSHAFEPFFTTKQKGKGSGLGLSTVYGIVRQSGGQITLYSQPAAGTIVEIYLPRTTEAVEAPHRKTAVLARGSETILLVDDEPGVRKLIAAILQAHGYTVIEAGNGASALTAFDKNAHKIDLVVTDIVMPQMNGYELAERLSEQSPAVKILFISGYRDNPIGGDQGGTPRPFLHKPFTPDSLLFKVRDVLDAG